MYETWRYVDLQPTGGSSSDNVSPIKLMICLSLIIYFLVYMSFTVYVYWHLYMYLCDISFSMYFVDIFLWKIAVGLRTKIIFLVLILLREKMLKSFFFLLFGNTRGNKLFCWIFWDLIVVWIVIVVVTIIIKLNICMQKNVSNDKYFTDRCTLWRWHDHAKIVAAILPL